MKEEDCKFMIGDTVQAQIRYDGDDFDNVDRFLEPPYNVHLFLTDALLHDQGPFCLNYNVDSLVSIALVLFEKEKRVPKSMDWKVVGGDQTQPPNECCSKVLTEKIISTSEQINRIIARRRLMESRTYIRVMLIEKYDIPIELPF